MKSLLITIPTVLEAGHRYKTWHAGKIRVALWHGTLCGEDCAGMIGIEHLPRRRSRAL